MVTLPELWLPIVLSAVAVFIASALAWMLMPHHKGDFKKLPNEDAVMAAVRQLNVSPGLYFFPNMAECNKAKMDPQAKLKFEQGPHGMLQVWPPGAFGKMGRNMALSFVFYLIVSFFVAYLASRSLAPNASFGYIFQITGTAAIMAYCFARIPNDIWFGTPPRNIVNNLIDGIAFGLITAAIFAWLWPAA